MAALSLSIALFGFSRKSKNGKIGWVKGLLWLLSFVAYFAFVAFEEIGK